MSALAIMSAFIGTDPEGWICANTERSLAIISAWPEAELYCAPGLEKKRPDLKGVVLGDDPPASWAG
jgi:hypothetical protein